MSKSEVYSWRVDPELKQALEAVARAERTSVGAVIEKACRELIGRSRIEGSESARQARLRLALFAAAAKVAGPGTSATSEAVREVFRHKRPEERARRHAAKSR